MWNDGAYCSLETSDKTVLSKYPRLFGQFSELLPIFDAGKQIPARNAG